MHYQDQLYGLIASAIRYVDLICDVPDLVQLLAATFRKVGNWFQIQEKWVQCLTTPWLNQGVIVYKTMIFIEMIKCHYTKYQTYSEISQSSCCYGLLRKIKTILDRIQIRKWIGPSARINVEYLSACRDWKGWFLD